jgi:hypothetical protein
MKEHNKQDLIIGRESLMDAMFESIEKKILLILNIIKQSILFLFIYFHHEISWEVLMMSSFELCML